MSRRTFPIMFTRNAFQRLYYGNGRRTEEIREIPVFLPSGKGQSILSSRPVSRSVATSATSSLTMFGSGTGDEGTMTI